MIQGIHSAQQYDDAMEEIGKLPDYKDYKPMSEMISLYSQLKGLSQNPFSSQSQTAFDALTNQSTATALNRSTSQDPSLSGVTLAGMNNAGLQQGAMRQMQGDQLRANYLGQLGNVASAFQDMSNMNVSGFNQRLNQREVALGNAASQARQSASEAWVGFGDESEAKVGKVMSMVFGGGMGGGAGNQPPTTNSASNTAGNRFQSQNANVPSSSFGGQQLSGADSYTGLDPAWMGGSNQANQGGWGNFQSFLNSGTFGGAGTGL